MSLLSFIPQIKAQIYEIRCISQQLEEGESNFRSHQEIPKFLMNPNPKIESYLDCGHELVCKPRASTTAGPTDGAARDSVARGAGGRTGSGASEELAAMEHRPTF